MPYSAAQYVDAFLAVTTNDIIPLTTNGVEAGCKVFGAAILRKSDLSLVIAATNDETTSPLLHGEINCIQQFWALPGDQRPPPKDCIFFATHEPCSLCLSGITWSGFDNHYHLFTYEDTRDSFAIPHDIRILEEVYKVPAEGESAAAFASRPLYNKSNAFWTARSVEELVADLPEEQQEKTRQRITEIKTQYAGLSETYQSLKGSKGIPLA